MNTHLTEQPLRLLDLPRELRDNVYEFALGFDSCRTAPCTIHEYSNLHAGAPIVKRRRLGINILLANKQIYGEAKPFLSNSNTFVRVEVQNANIQDWFHGPSQPIHIFSISDTGGCIPEPHPSLSEEEPKVFPHCEMDLVFQLGRFLQSSRSSHSLTTRIVMLLSDLSEFCKRLETERMHHGHIKVPDMGVTLRVTLNAGTNTDEEGNCEVPSRRIQEQLLQPIRDGIRGCRRLTIEGCTHEDLLEDTMQIVKQPHWPDAHVLLTELSIHRERADDAEHAKNDLACVAACTKGISVIDRLSNRHTRFDGGRLPRYIRAVLDEVKEYSYHFHIAIARCLLNQLNQLFLSENPRLRSSKELFEELSTIYADVFHVLQYIVQGEFHKPGRELGVHWFPTFTYRPCCFPCQESYYLLASAGRIILENADADGNARKFPRRQTRVQFIKETRAYLRKAWETSWKNEVYIEERRRFERIMGVGVDVDPWSVQKRSKWVAPSSSGRGPRTCCSPGQRWRVNRGDGSSGLRVWR